MILKTRKIGIWDGTISNDPVVLSAINEGVDGSAVFGLSNEHNELTVNDGQTYINSANPSLDVRVLKPNSSDVTQLKSWASNHTDVYVTGLTIDGYFMFGHYNGLTLVNPAKIVVNEQLSDNDVFAFRVTKTTDFGYNPSTGIHYNGFSAGKNMLSTYDWADTDSDGTADGWDIVRFATSFSNGEQTLTHAVGGDQHRMRKRVFFPFVGERPRFGFTLVSENDYGGNYDFDFAVYYYAKNNATLDLGVSQIANEGGALIDPTPSGIVAVEVEFNSFEVTAGSQDGELVVSNPILNPYNTTGYSKF